MASEAFNMIAFPPFHRELVVYVNKKVKDKALSEDIVQEVFIKVQTKLGQLKDHSKVTSWIYQITGNTIIDHFRSKSKTLKPADLDWENERHEFNECVASCLSKLLNTLPEKYRVPLELAEIQNLSQTEMLIKLGYSADKKEFRSIISAYEIGKREPTLIDLLKYARMVNILVEVLIDDELVLFEILSANKNEYKK